MKHALLSALLSVPTLLASHAFAAELEAFGCYSADVRTFPNWYLQLGTSGGEARYVAASVDTRGAIPLPTKVDFYRGAVAGSFNANAASFSFGLSGDLNAVLVGTVAERGFDATLLLSTSNGSTQSEALKCYFGQLKFPKEGE